MARPEVSEFLRHPYQQLGWSLYPTTEAGVFALDTNQGMMPVTLPEISTIKPNQEQTVQVPAGKREELLFNNRNLFQVGESGTRYQLNPDWDKKITVQVVTDFRKDMITSKGF